MKYLSFFLLFLPFALVAQKSKVFKIDSIPTEGVLLDKGWKWHAGDNPEWANVDFDDSSWENIKPLLDFYKIPQVREAEISWFRFPIEVDSALVNVPLIANLNLNGAAELYFNGTLLQKRGIVSKDPKVEKTLATSFVSPVNISFSKNKGNMIAIRFSFTRSNLYAQFFTLTKKNPFSLNIRQLTGFSEVQLANSHRYLMRQIPYLSLFLIFAFIHFSFYYFLPIQKANLLFGFAMLFHSFGFLINYLAGLNLTVSGFIICKLLVQPCAMCVYIFKILAVHYYLKRPFKRVFWLIPILFLLVYPLQFIEFRWNYFMMILIFPISIFYYLIVIRKSIQEGNKEGKIIYYTGLLCLLSTTAYVIPVFLQVLGIHGQWDKWNWNTCLNINFLSFTIGMSLTLARDFAFTNHSLDNKSKEVQQLSTEKHRIATDMHDDIGSDLSALNMQIERIRQKLTTGKQPLTELDHLVESSRDVAKKVREVIWTINARHDSLASIVNYFDTYTDDFFEPTDIVVRTSIPSEIPDVVINGESRKVLLMCFKETLNNLYKHAKASELATAFTFENQTLTVSIKDNGMGFDPSVLTASTTNGNGLMNLQERMAGIGGKCMIETSGTGTLVVLSLPI